MSKRLDETLNAPGYDGLIIGNEPVADVVTVQLAAGNGIVVRGTVVTGAAGGELKPVSEALTADNATYIITDDVDTTAATTATAYRTGKFAENRLITDGSYKLTAADKEILRKSGILLDTAIEA
ncbi:MAG: head decoration protein [Oscillospiraceae bacterium]|nr:head decoration protein [Oscillospiraceae bacterium]